MTLTDTIINTIQCIEQINDTWGTNNKKDVLECYAKDDLHKKDIMFAVDYLNGGHSINYKLIPANMEKCNDKADWMNSFEDIINHLIQLTKDAVTVFKVSCELCKAFGKHDYFLLMKLVNREYRLGLGKSVLPKSELTPMLAKKFQEAKVSNYTDFYGFYVTEKLDGNRCIASYDYANQQWKFTSRSGKPLNIQLNMDGFDKWYVYDGELLSKEQREHPSQRNFNTLSGMINSNSKSKDLLYLIFDITNIENMYVHRRNSLSRQQSNDQVMVLPVLAHYKTWEELNCNIFNLLKQVTSQGKEGLMINVGTGFYEHKRTDQLLKLKDVQTMDMMVRDINPGTGKNEGLVGSLLCTAISEDGSVYECSVGSGLTDYQRSRWANYPDEILGKIVEVAYFSTSQSKVTNESHNYSLRFPRLVRVRYDKDTTSTH